MNCPKCKNPIDDNATVCEWCGTSFVTKELETKKLETKYLETKVKTKKYRRRKILNILIIIFLISCIMNMIMSLSSGDSGETISFFVITGLLVFGFIKNRKWLKNNKI